MRDHVVCARILRKLADKLDQGVDDKIIIDKLIKTAASLSCKQEGKLITLHRLVSASQAIAHKLNEDLAVAQARSLDDELESCP